MNRERARELIPIIQAFADGEDIDARGADGEWVSLEADEDLLCLDECDYRIKPKPREFYIEFWPKAAPTVTCLDSQSQKVGRIKVREVE